MLHLLVRVLIYPRPRTVSYAAVVARAVARAIGARVTGRGTQRQRARQKHCTAVA